MKIEQDQTFEPLHEMAIELQRWLDYQEYEHKNDGIPIHDDTHVRHPPAWPTRGQLKAWISELKGESK